MTHTWAGQDRTYVCVCVHARVCVCVCMCGGIPGKVTKQCQVTILSWLIADYACINTPVFQIM